ncbi:HK97 gp10 family phage protein [Brevibacillus sp. SYP-B805]|uniref:HK97 gp10 family phage protein n=1 Tax=Brevibacillus sp. SYP-B805 TaxID=1578199 RepID=UPI0013EA1ED9|nr:HK97 gp10 family phage protein [Brevibacillus sp. SYP-B805]NGQ95498.1 HK97 gp10 family phage protein [Brevibacillus sp. SYP-B805]
MARDFELDVTKFIRALDGATEAIARGAKRGLHDALDDWRREATDVAPLDKGTLRRGIDTQIEGDGLDLTGEISAVAIEDSRKGRFNYAYYLHEVKGEIKNPTTPGTIAKFLDVPAEQNEKKWLDMIEDEIKAGF